MHALCLKEFYILKGFSHIQSISDAAASRSGTQEHGLMPMDACHPLTGMSGMCSDRQPSRRTDS